MGSNRAYNADPSPRAAALVELAQRTLGQMSDQQRTAGLVSLRSRMSARQEMSAPFRFGLGAGVAVAFAALVLTVVPHFRGLPAQLSYRVEGAEPNAAGSVEAVASKRPILRFSDGSEVSLEEGARVQVRALDERGARVSLEQGQAHVYVVHAPGTRWAFDAGPFVVAVTGTAFRIAWAASEHRLDVRMENGSVMVTGPVSDAPIAVRAGQWLTVRSNEVLIRDNDAVDAEAADPRAVESSTTPPASTLGSEAAGEASETVAGSGGRRGLRASSVMGDHHWASALARGRFEAIVEQARRLGLDLALAQCGGEDLAALADAARYTRNGDLARAALLSIRRRFPTSERARVAGFSLGRLAESRGDLRAALGWFETYLTEAPEGTYASEALGRKMTLVQAINGNEAAQPLAEAYLRRFPAGTYAQAAHALTPGP